MRRSISAVLLSLLLILSACSYYSRDPFEKIRPASDIELPPLFSDHCVLQQKQTVPVWGKASPGGQLRIEIGRQKLQTLVNAEGRWQVELAPMDPGQPLTLKVMGADTLLVRDVLIGEVWVCSGQSNMEWPVVRSDNAEAEMLAAQYPKLHLLTVDRAMALNPLDDINSSGWQVCNPKTVEHFSAAAYFFGRKLLIEANVPVGLIHTSWGGTPAEAWTSGAALKKMPDFMAEVEKIEQNAEKLEISVESSADQLAQWTQDLNAMDAGYENGRPIWNRPDMDDSAWPVMTLPTTWESGGLGGYDGIVWFRKAIALPENWVHSDLKLSLGPVDDVDSTWVNGQFVGGQPVWNAPRQYDIPAEINQSAALLIAVRVLDTGGGGGIYGNPVEMKLYHPAGDSLSIAGAWKYQAAVPAEKIKPLPNQNLPTVLYNAMLAPLIPYSIRGAIWYQGESNAGRAWQYRSLFPAMITDWRTRWQQGDFPFYFVQLANFGTRGSEPRDNDWAELREAQSLTLSLPNTGMAVTIDIGNPDDIHPTNKQEVGRRLALNVLSKTYGFSMPWSGPHYRSMTVEGNAIRLAFDHVYEGLQVKGDSLSAFAIAGADRRFVWAKAVIDGRTIVVSSPEVTAPKAVRYGWDAAPVCNLYNSEGLPASPFRTDAWPGITEPE